MPSFATPLKRSPRLAVLERASNTPSRPILIQQSISTRPNAIFPQTPPAADSSASAQPTAQDSTDAAVIPSAADSAPHGEHPTPTLPTNFARSQVPPAATPPASTRPVATQDGAGASSAPTASQALGQKRLWSDAFAERPQAYAKKAKASSRKGKGKAPLRDRKPMRQMALSWARKGAEVGEGPAGAGPAASVEGAGLGKVNAVLGGQQGASTQAQTQTQWVLRDDRGEGSSSSPSTWKSGLLPTTTICKTYALDSYKLKPIDLRSLTFTVQESKNEREMHLYNAQQVEQLAWKVHGGPEGFKKMLDTMEKEHIRKGNKTPFRRPVYTRIPVRGKDGGKIVSERLVREKI